MMFARRLADCSGEKQSVNEECFPVDVSTELLCNDNDGSRAYPDGCVTEAPASSMDARPNPFCRSSTSPAAAVAPLQAATNDGQMMLVVASVADAATLATCMGFGVFGSSGSSCGTS